MSVKNTPNSHIKLSDSINLDSTNLDYDNEVLNSLDEDSPDSEFDQADSDFEDFDYVSPMVYPSHYVNGFLGFENPAEHPYEIVKYSLDSAKQRREFMSKISSAGKDAEEAAKIAKEKLGKLRPWLQDFNIGAVYDARMIKLEIQAVKDALGEDYNGFMLWNPSNVYTQGAIWKSP